MLQFVRFFHVVINGFKSVSLNRALEHVAMCGERLNKVNNSANKSSFHSAALARIVGKYPVPKTLLLSCKYSLRARRARVAAKLIKDQELRNS